MRGAIRFLPSALMMLLGACSDANAPEAHGGVRTEAQHRVTTSTLPLPAPVAPTPSPAAATVCRNLALVSDPPNPITSPSDDAYMALKLAGRDAIPCLVDALSSTEPLSDP